MEKIKCEGIGKKLAHEAAGVLEYIVSTNGGKEKRVTLCDSCADQVPKTVQIRLASEPVLQGMI